MLFDSFIRSPLVGATVFVAFKTAVLFHCTAVGKQICSFDSPLLEAEPPRFLGFKLSIFSPLCEFSEYSIMAEPVIPYSRATLIPVARAIYSIV